MTLEELLVLIIATPIFSLPTSLAASACFGLAILGTYVVRQR
jgi:hypothetical protein